MKALYLLITIYVAIVVTGCSSHKQQPMGTAVINTSVPKKMAALSPSHKKNPITVAVYVRETPQKPYVVVGREIISKYNLGGIKRQEASLRDTMRDLAASVGGDAVINVEHHNDKITATIIAYDNRKLV